MTTWTMTPKAQNHHTIRSDADYLPLVADVHSGQADARLIAAAPDLLAALEKAVYMNASPREWIELARAAIRKATGGQP